MTISIRPATRQDIPLILDFIRALAAFEREPDAVQATEADLEREGFGPNPIFFCLIAESSGQPAGFALSFYNFSTWTGRRGIHLEDLFVHPRFRGQGVGKALFQAVARAAVEQGCGRFQWDVLDWNTPAIDFYKSMGSQFMDEWRMVRLSGDALRRAAGMPEVNP
jgi:GNAT superfamily N-acetyltransferase